MQPKLPHYLTGHLTAVLGVVVLHIGLVAWAMQSSEPIAIPQQQVIQVAMIGASSPEEKENAKRPEKHREEPVKPIKPEGLKKAEPKPKPHESTDVKKKSEKSEEVVNNQPLASVSGPQTAEATEKQAAVTEPSLNAAYLNNPSPEYPHQSKRRGIQGKVLLEVKVTADGKAKEVSIYSSSGSKLLDEAAQTAVRNWRFVPAHRGTEAVEATVLVPVEFKLN